MATMATNIQQVRDRIAKACEAAGRPVQSVTLLAVSKTFPAAVVYDAFNAGQRCFGENYVQEAIDKMDALADLRGHVEWHLIGPVQSNKTRLVADRFDWVHTVDRLKIAERLSAQRPPAREPLQICLQVNVSGETSKAGLDARDVVSVADAVAKLPHLRLRGLMSIPEPASDLASQRRAHRALREVFDQLNAGGHRLDTLSMGMSADLEAAVLEGATIVRIGTAIFGQR
jgi:pyridoxal phosphate enzyme (YggS family)